MIIKPIRAQQIRFSTSSTNKPTPRHHFDLRDYQIAMHNPLKNNFVLSKQEQTRDVEHVHYGLQLEYPSNYV
jgi:hypothetical protein